jgi:hypothetical protein
VKLVVLVVLTACSSHLELRGAPPDIPAVISDGAGATLAMPPFGEARSDALSNGWPVWTVHHFDGTVTVVNGVGPARTRSAEILFAANSALVRWLPTTRRMLAGDVVYDELGHVLGYAADECRDDCPRIAVPAPQERDLDTFAMTLASDQIVVGQRRAAPPNTTPPGWHDVDSGEHAARDLELASAYVLPAIPIAGALERPYGSYAIVTGAIVRSTFDTPRLCACGPCDPSAPRVLGLDAVSVNQAAFHDEAGMVLVRRDPQGLALIAMSRSRTCH